MYSNHSKRALKAVGRILNFRKSLKIEITKTCDRLSLSVRPRYNRTLGIVSVSRKAAESGTLNPEELHSVCVLAQIAPWVKPKS